MGAQTFVMVSADQLQMMLDKLESIEDRLSRAIVIPGPEWLSIPDAAIALGCSKATIYRQIERGELEAKGAGRQRKVKVQRHG